MNRCALLGLCLTAALLLPLAAGCSDATPVDTVTPAESGPVAELPAPQFAPDDWPWWRGPTRNGIAAADARPPTEWSESKNIVWKAPVPGRGHSSPTVVADRIVLATADEAAQVQSVVCFDRAAGTQLWQTEINRGGFPEQIHTKNTHASGTVACDGERLFIALYNHGRIQATALDLDGKQLWQQPVGTFDPRRYPYGYAPSPLIAGSLVIIAADYDGGGYLTGLHRETGQLVWRQPRPAMISYSSPVVADVAGREQLLLSGCDLVAAYHPLSGEPLWSCAATTNATCGTMVWDGELVFASGGYPGRQTACVKADGSGEIVWSNGTKCYEQSMLAANGALYAVDDGGIAYCWKSETGEELWRKRLGGNISASPVLAGDHIYQSNEAGTTFVIKADPQRLELVASNQLGGESFASPAVCGERMFLRVATGSGGGRQEWLYCVGAVE